MQPTTGSGPAFYDGEWHETYDILEFVAQHINAIHVGNTFASRTIGKRFLDAANQTLESELSGHRFVKGQLAPITDPAEVAAIEQAASYVVDETLAGHSIHIRKALELLGQRPNPTTATQRRSPSAQSRV